MLTSDYFNNLRSRHSATKETTAIVICQDLAGTMLPSPKKQTTPPPNACETNNKHQLGSKFSLYMNYHIVKFNYTCSFSPYHTTYFHRKCFNF